MLPTFSNTKQFKWTLGNFAMDPSKWRRMGTMDSGKWQRMDIAADYAAVQDMDSWQYLHTSC